MRAWKDDVVGKLRDGIAGQMKRFKVDVAAGQGELLGGGRVRVTPAGGGAPEEHQAKAILVATGSVPALPPIPGARDNPRVLDSTGLLEIEAVPQRLCVIGGGVIGVEFASLFAALGCKVTVVEMLDEESCRSWTASRRCSCARAARRDLQAGLPRAAHRGRHDALHEPQGRGGERRGRPGADGRRPPPRHLGLGRRSGGARRSSSRGVAVDERMRTNVPRPLGRGPTSPAAAAGALGIPHGRRGGGGHPGQPRTAAARAPCACATDAVPWAVYSLPEAAGVGLTEAGGRRTRASIHKASLRDAASGRFVAENAIAALGSVKLIALRDRRPHPWPATCRRRLRLRVHSGAARALIEQELRARDLRELILPHPRVCELIRDAAGSCPEPLPAHSAAGRPAPAGSLHQTTPLPQGNSHAQQIQHIDPAPPARRGPQSSAKSPSTSTRATSRRSSPPTAATGCAASVRHGDDPRVRAACSTASDAGELGRCRVQPQGPAHLSTGQEGLVRSGIA